MSVGATQPGGTAAQIDQATEKLKAAIYEVTAKQLDVAEQMVRVKGVQKAVDGLPKQ